MGFRMISKSFFRWKNQKVIWKYTFKSNKPTVSPDRSNCDIISSLITVMWVNVFDPSFFQNEKRLHYPLFQTSRWTCSANFDTVISFMISFSYNTCQHNMFFFLSFTTRNVNAIRRYRIYRLVTRPYLSHKSILRRARPTYPQIQWTRARKGDRVARNTLT